MKQSACLHTFRDAFQSVRPDNFTYEGLEALFDHFEELEADMGKEIELDVIAICCDYSQYDSATEAYNELCNDELEGDDDEEKEENALEWLRDNGSVIEVGDGSVIVYGQ